MTEAFSAPFIRVIDANRTVKDELAAAVQLQSTRRRISVTDIIDPRKAFFSRMHPEVPPSADRVQAMMAGTGFHNEFERAVSTEEFAEQLVEYEGIVGKIDIYEDLPVELKTTRALRPGLESIYSRYVDQLGAYAIMTSRQAGHLLLYGRGEFGRPPELRAFQVVFTNLPPAQAEMLHRRDLLRSALETGEPTGLLRCTWFGRCEYQALCGCESAPEMAPLVGAGDVTLQRDEAIETRFSDRLQTGTDKPSGFRFYHLVFPRKAAFGLLEDGDDAAPSTQDRLGQMDRRGFFRVLDDVLARGMPGAFARVPVRVGKLADRVRLHRGLPTLLKSSKARDFIERKRLPTERPWNVDTLAFQCALLGTDTGRLVLYYEAIPENKFMVYDVMFSDLQAVRAEAERRLRLLESGASPAELPPCPAWMAKNCPYRDRCGCGDAA